MWFLISFFEDQNLLFDKGDGAFPENYPQKVPKGALSH